MLLSKKKFTFQRKKTENLEDNNNEDSEKLEDKNKINNKYISDKNSPPNELILSKLNFRGEENYSPKYSQNNDINTLNFDNTEKEIISNNNELQYLINQNEDENLDFINTLLKLKGISLKNTKNCNSSKDLGIKANLDGKNDFLLKSKKKLNIRNDKNNQSNSSNQTTKINSFNNINQQNENNYENGEEEIFCSLSEKHIESKNEEFEKSIKITTKSEQNLCQKGLISIFNKNNIKTEISMEKINLENKNREELKVDYKRKKYLKIPINQKNLYFNRNNNIYNNKNNKIQNNEKLDKNGKEVEDEINKKSFKKIPSIDNLKERNNHTINHINNNNNINQKSIINKRIVKRKKSMNNNNPKNDNISNYLGNKDTFENKSCINIQFTSNKNQKKIKTIQNENNKTDSKMFIDNFKNKDIIKKYVYNNLKLSINKQRRNEFLKVNISYDKYCNKIPISKEIKNKTFNFNKENFNKKIEKSPDKKINIIPIKNHKPIYNTNLNSYTKIVMHKISNSNSNKKKSNIFPKNINNIICEDIYEINNKKIKDNYNDNIKNKNNLSNLMDKTTIISNSKLVQQLNKKSPNKIENQNNDKIKTKNFKEQDINISVDNEKRKKIKKSKRAEIYLFDN